MPSALLRLRTALRNDSDLQAKIQEGLAALKPIDRKLICEAYRSAVADSLDLDAATKQVAPQAHRWDYILSVSSAGWLAGIEPHSARDSEIKVVIAKRSNAIDYLRSHLRPQHRVMRWYWVSHGRVGFSMMERARRLLDQNGIEFAGRTLRFLP